VREGERDRERDGESEGAEEAVIHGRVSDGTDREDTAGTVGVFRFAVARGEPENQACNRL
jgi:hypothetical protein